MPTIKIVAKSFKKNAYEKLHWAQNELVCGIDEVGRSCLAGPVVAAAAILEPGAKHPLLKDSKKLNQQQREEVYAWLQSKSVYGIGIINHRIIDKINIYQATLVAMHRAVMQLLAAHAQKPAVIVIDAMPLIIPSLEIPIYHFNFGEDYSTSIAAASIIAKVTRDTLMARLDKDFPGYSWATNKGYGTKAHVEGLQKHEKVVIHRNSFLKRFTEVCE